MATFTIDCLVVYMMNAFYQREKRVIHLILLSSLIRLLLCFVPMNVGEAYYARGAADLQLSYFDQPPLFFWLSGFFVKIFGYNNLALRLPSIILFAGTTYLIYKLSLRFYANRQAAYMSALLLNISAVFTFSIGFFYQPDGPLIFFWLLSFYAICKIFFPEHGDSQSAAYRKSRYVLKWFLILGISLGLTALSKYHIVFLIFGVAVFMLLRKSYRHWYWHYGPYLAVLIMLLLFMPVLWWNYNNEWISFLFQSTRAGSTETQLRFDWLLRSIGGQALWILPWIWVPMIIQIPLILKRDSTQPWNALLAWSSLPLIIFFTLVTLWSNLQFHFHWQAPGYLMLFIPLGLWMEQKRNSRFGLIFRRITRSTIAISLVLFGILAWHVQTGGWTFYGPKWLANQFKEKNDPTIFVNDFDAVKAKFEERGWLKDDKVFAACTRWWFSGLVDYSLNAEKEFIIFSDDPRNYAFFSDPQKLVGKDAVVVLPPGYSSTVTEDVVPFFDRVEKTDSCWVERWKGENELKVYFYYCSNFKLPTVPKENLPVYASLKGVAPFYYVMNKKRNLK